MIRLLLLMVLSASLQASILPTKGPLFWTENTVEKLIPEDRALYAQEALFAVYAAYLQTKKASIAYKDFFYSSLLRYYKSKGVYLKANKSEGNHLASKYKDEDGGYIDEDFVVNNHGLCVGYTSTLRKFAYLAFFQPDMKAPFDEKTHKKQRTKYYKKIIDDIFANKPRIIPGFKNLSEFSGQPEWAVYLKRHVVEQWALINNTRSAYRIAYTPRFLQNFTSTGLEKMNKRLRSFLDYGLEPTIYISIGYVEDSHNVRVQSADLDLKDKKLMIKEIDTNNKVYKNSFQEGGRAFYITSHQEALYGEIIFNLVNFCQDKKEICANRLEFHK